jgi:hypothetical protein
MQGIQLFRCVATFRRHSNKKEEDDEVRLVSKVRLVARKPSSL